MWEDALSYYLIGQFEDASGPGGSDCSPESETAVQFCNYWPAAQNLKVSWTAAQLLILGREELDSSQEFEDELESPSLPPWNQNWSAAAKFPSITRVGH